MTPSANLSAPRRILFLQDHASIGGAAKAAGRLAEALSGLGHEVCVAAGDAKPEGASFRLSGKPPRGPIRLWEWLIPRMARDRQRKLRVGRQWKMLLQKLQPDLVWAHNLHGGAKWGWHEELLETALAHAPLLWTLHDMWALGNGAVYFDETEMGKKTSPSPLDRLVQNPAATARLRLTAPSDWMCRLAQAAASTKCHKWECVLDPRQMSPEGRQISREALGLKNTDLFLIAVAENLNDSRKGFDLLRQAWNLLKMTPWVSRLRLGLVGRGSPENFRGDPHVQSFGEVSEPARLAGWVAAADLYLHPAELDNFPLTVQEAQACGTPAVVFDRGGLAETVEHGRTGWVLPRRSAETLAKMIEEVAENPACLVPMRCRARERILERQNPTVWSQSWHSVLDSFPPGTFSRPS